MSAQSGHEVKIKIGDFEAKQKLGPPGEYNIYRFEVNVEAPKGSRLLGIMPTDSLDQPVAIHSIKLIPKPASFPNPSGRHELGKSDEYRSTLYIHSPSTIVFPVTVPTGGSPSRRHGNHRQRQPGKFPYFGTWFVPLNFFQRVWTTLIVGKMPTSTSPASAVNPSSSGFKLTQPARAMSLSGVTR